MKKEFEQEPLGSPEILYEDEHLVIVFKPNRLLVHRTEMDFYDTRNLRRWLAEKLDLKVDPVHRLDKPTSGLVIFTKHKDAMNAMRDQFVEGTIQKTYYALVRGFTQAEGRIEKPLQKEKDLEAKNSLTLYKTLKHVEVPIEVSRYPQSRYSFVEVEPKTGRFHQIRLHFSHLRHPIIGDTRHGDRKHNHMFRDQLNLPPLFLHAGKLKLVHPEGFDMNIESPLPLHYRTIFDLWDWNEGAAEL